VSPSSIAGVVSVKAGVQFTAIAPAGFRLLGAIERAARALRVELTITSACDGAHSGPDDPHHRGEAYDVRSKTLTLGQKEVVLFEILRGCSDEGMGLPERVPGIAHSQSTARFFGFLEAAGTDNEHIHVQLRKGRNYP
jgi:hypothetical protein